MLPENETNSQNRDAMQTQSGAEIKQHLRDAAPRADIMPPWVLRKRRRRAWLRLAAILVGVNVLIGAALWLLTPLGLIPEIAGTMFMWLGGLFQVACALKVVFEAPGYWMQLRESRQHYPDTPDQLGQSAAKDEIVELTLQKQRALEDHEELATRRSSAGKGLMKFAGAGVAFCVLASFYQNPLEGILLEGFPLFLSMMVFMVAVASGAASVLAFMELNHYTEEHKKIRGLRSDREELLALRHQLADEDVAGALSVAADTGEPSGKLTVARGDEMSGGLSVHGERRGDIE